jgi:hypothetical protein
VQVGQEGQHVFVVKPDKTVEVRPVTLESTNEGEAVIAKGLAPGEQIVREGQFLLGPGSRIEIKDLARTADELKDGGRRERGDKGRGKVKANGSERGDDPVQKRESKRVPGHSGAAVVTVTVENARV